jgi:hypothetical protein
MHYEDERCLKENKLVLVVYKHGVLDGDDDEYYVQICSIQECQYMLPHLAAQVIGSFDYIFLDAVKGMKEEVYYKAEIRHNERARPELVTLEEIPKPDAETAGSFLFLH